MVNCIVWKNATDVTIFLVVSTSQFLQYGKGQISAFYRQFPFSTLPMFNFQVPQETHHGAIVEIFNGVG